MTTTRRRLGRCVLLATSGHMRQRLEGEVRPMTRQGLRDAIAEARRLVKRQVARGAKVFDRSSSVYVLCQGREPIRIANCRIGASWDKVPRGIRCNMGRQLFGMQTSREVAAGVLRATRRRRSRKG